MQWLELVLPRPVADVFPIYCAVTVIRLRLRAGLRGGKYQVGLKAVSKKGRMPRGQGGREGASSW